MSNFKKLGGPEIPFQGAFAVSGEFIDPAPKIYKIPSFNSVVGDSTQRGWLELDLTAQKPQITGELASDNLDLRPLFAGVEKKGEGKAESVKSAVRENKKSKAKTKAANAGAQADKVFSAEPLPLDRLSRMDVDLTFRDKQVLLPTMALNDVIVDVLLRNGNLEIKPFKFTIGGGNADVQFALHSRKTPAAMVARLDIDQLGSRRFGGYPRER